ISALLAVEQCRDHLVGHVFAHLVVLAKHRVVAQEEPAVAVGSVGHGASISRLVPVGYAVTSPCSGHDRTAPANGWCSTGYQRTHWQDSVTSYSTVVTLHPSSLVDAVATEPPHMRDRFRQAHPARRIASPCIPPRSVGPPGAAETGADDDDEGGVHAFTVPQSSQIRPALVT